MRVALLVAIAGCTDGSERGNGQALSPDGGSEFDASTAGPDGGWLQDGSLPADRDSSVAGELDGSKSHALDSGSAPEGSVPEHEAGDSSMPPDSAVTTFPVGCGGNPGWSWHDLYPKAAGSDVIALWSAAAHDVWESRGLRGYLHHFDGTQWTDVPVADGVVIHSLYGTSSNDVWAAGSGGLIAHWDGSTWSCSPRVTNAMLLDVWAGAADNVWVGGKRGTVLRWEGHTWADASPGFPWPGNTCPTSDVRNVWGSGPSDVWTEVDHYCGSGLHEWSGVAHWNGSSWQDMLSIGYYGNGWASSPGNVVVMVAQSTQSETSGMTYETWNGSSWAQAGPVSDSNPALKDVWGVGAADLWLASASEVRHWDGTSLRSYPVGGNRIIGSTTANVWLYGPGGNRRSWNGSAWEDRSSPLTTEARGEGFARVWSSGADAVWAITTSGKLLRLGTTGWESVAGAPPVLSAVWGTRPNDLRAVDGSSDMVYRFDGQSWAQLSTGSGAPLRAIWGTGSNDVWAVGDSRVVAGLTPRYQTNIVHWDGQAWNVVSLGSDGPGAATSISLRSLAGSGPEDVWATGSTIGTGGGVLHWNGSVWNQVTGPMYGGSVWVGSATDVWIYNLGPSSPVYHWDGGAWSTTNYYGTMFAGSGSSDRWEFEDNSIQRFDGSTDHEVFTGFEDDSLHIADAWVSSTHAYIVTTEGISIQLTR